MTDPVTLNFGGRNLAELYNNTGSKEQVFNYLQAVIDNHATLNPPIDEARRKELESIKQQINLLIHPDGTEYIGPVADPALLPQHIRRELDPVWPKSKLKPSAKKKAGMSLFKIRAEVPTHDWAMYTAGKRLYWNQYDLLGLFFSKMGPAPGSPGTPGTSKSLDPPVADQSKFYLPLTAVYAKFCFWIGGNQLPSMKKDGGGKPGKGAGTGDPPACFQCTWNEKTGQFFLGASLEGYRSNEHKIDYGAWEDVVRGKRWHLFDNFYGFPGTWGPFEEGRSPMRKWTTKTTLFGNCGETYPFLEMFGSQTNPDDRLQIRGLALGKAFARVSEYRTEDFYPMITPPCLNCQQMLRFVGGPSPVSFAQDATMNIPVYLEPYDIGYQSENGEEN